MTDVIMRVKGEDQASNMFKDILASAGGFLAANVFQKIGAGIVDFAKSSVQAASDLGETINKTNEIFEESSKGILDWAKTAATGAGLAEKDALDAASGMAIFGKAAGLAGQDLNDFAINNVQMAADMASFFNTSVTDASTALQAAFRGETEPIRRYGVLLDDASLRQKALELGIVSTTKKALTPQQKVLAANELITTQLADAQGDFARTSDGLANSQRILTAQIDNAKTSLGEAFLPIVTKVVGVLNTQGIPVLLEVIDLFKAMFRSITVMFPTDPLGGIMDALYQLGWTLENTFNIKGANEFFSNIADALPGLASQFSGAFSSISSIRESVMGFLQTMSAWWAENSPPIIEAASKIGSVIVEFWGKVVSDIGPLFKSILDQISGWFIANGPLIQEFVTVVADFFRNRLLPAALALWEGVKILVSGIIELLGGLVTFVMQVITGDWAGAWATLQNAISNAMDKVVEILGHLIDAIAKIFGSSYEKFYSWGQSIIDGIKQGISNAWNGMISFFSGKIEELKSMVAGLFDSHSPSRWAAGLGEDIMAGLGLGIGNGIQVPVTAMSRAMPAMAGAVSGMGVAGMSTGTGMNVNITISSPITFLDQQNAVENIRSYVVQAVRSARAEGLI